MKKTLNTAITEKDILKVFEEIDHLHYKEQTKRLNKSDLHRFSQIVGQQIFPSKWFEIMDY